MFLNVFWNYKWIYFRYVASVESLYSNISFVDLCCVVFEMVTVLFYEQEEFWLIGTFIMFSSIVQLFVICLIGLIIDIKNDELYSDIINIPWYNMYIKERLILIPILNAAQNPKTLSFGGLLKLTWMLLFRFVKIFTHILWFWGIWDKYRHITYNI